MRPIIEPYLIHPSRREQRRQRIEWIVAAGLVSLMLWYCGWMIAEVVGIRNSFTAAYERVVSAASGK